MGTNYYLRVDACPHCGRSESELHIGKSSAGWCFGLHVMPEEGLHSLENWVDRWNLPNNRIVDEYGRQVTQQEMLDEVTCRQWGKAPDPSRFAENHACLGPNNLFRHAIGQYCVGHGAGTWDLVPGEFS